jgi:twinkle protein
MAKPEEAMAKSYKMLVGKAAGRIFHDPNMDFDREAWDAAEPLIGDNAIFCDAYQFVNWDQLKEDILYTVVNDGVRDVMIDPITCLTNQMSAGEANEKLTGIAAEISAMAKDHEFTAYLFCHLKAPLMGDPHERGGRVLSTQFAGSRAMMRSCNYMFGVRGNKDPELPLEERNIRYLDILEDREFGVSGTVPLYWDFNTGMFNEI